MHWQILCKVNAMNSTLLHSIGQIIFKYGHSKVSSGQRDFPNTHYLAYNKWSWAADSSLSDILSLFFCHTSVGQRRPHKTQISPQIWRTCYQTFSPDILKGYTAW